LLHLEQFLFFGEDNGRLEASALVCFIGCLCLPLEFQLELFLRNCFAVGGKLVGSGFQLGALVLSFFFTIVFKLFWGSIELFDSIPKFWQFDQLCCRATQWCTFV
jgi:hypothetical protein